MKRAPASVAREESYNVFLLPSFLVMVVFVVGGLIWNFGISFLRWPGFGPAKFVGFDNYVRLAQNQTFWDSFLHALYYVIPMSIIPMVLGFVLASLTHDYFRGRAGRWALPLVRGGLYLPQIVPIAVAGVVWGWLLNNATGVVDVTLREWGLDALALDWLNNAQLALLSLSFIMVWLQLGFTFVIFVSGLGRVDQSMVEAASLDGASWWQRMRWVIVPELRPEIYVVSLLTVVGALKVFAPVFYITRGGPSGATASPSTLAVLSFFGGTPSVGFGSAVSTILAILLGVGAAIVLSLQRGSAFRRGGE
jgi:raffinose/stachyose/melibiose transport system permease protein